MKKDMSARITMWLKALLPKKILEEGSLTTKRKAL